MDLKYQRSKLNDDERRKRNRIAAKKSRMKRKLQNEQEATDYSSNQLVRLRLLQELHQLTSQLQLYKQQCSLINKVILDNGLGSLLPSNTQQVVYQATMLAAGQPQAAASPHAPLPAVCPSESLQSMVKEPGATQPYSLSPLEWADADAPPLSYGDHCQVASSGSTSRTNEMHCAADDLHFNMASSGSPASIADVDDTSAGEGELGWGELPESWLEGMDFGEAGEGLGMELDIWWEGRLSDELSASIEETLFPAPYDTEDVTVLY